MCLSICDARWRIKLCGGAFEGWVTLRCTTKVRTDGVAWCGENVIAAAETEGESGKWRRRSCRAPQKKKSPAGASGRSGRSVKDFFADKDVLACCRRPDFVRTTAAAGSERAAYFFAASLSLCAFTIAPSIWSPRPSFTLCCKIAATCVPIMAGLVNCAVMLL